MMLFETELYNLVFWVSAMFCLAGAQVGMSWAGARKGNKDGNR